MKTIRKDRMTMLCEIWDSAEPELKFLHQQMLLHQQMSYDMWHMYKSLRS